MPAACRPDFGERPFRLVRFQVLCKALCYHGRTLKSPPRVRGGEPLDQVGQLLGQSSSPRARG